MIILIAKESKVDRRTDIFVCCDFGFSLGFFVLFFACFSIKNRVSFLCGRSDRAYFEEGQGQFLLLIVTFFCINLEKKKQFLFPIGVLQQK